MPEDPKAKSESGEPLDELAAKLRGILRQCATEPLDARLAVMRQNPDNYHYWSKSCGTITVHDLKLMAVAAEQLSRIFQAAEPSHD